MNLNEGLIDVLFDKIVYNIRVVHSGSNIEFKIFLPGSKSALSLKVKTNTLIKFKVWFDKIYSGIINESN